MAFDSSYLKETVGEALARGCASAVTAEPNDPVEYLGRWLLRYVKNAEVEGKFYMERDHLKETKQKAKEGVEAAKVKMEELKAEKAAALQALSESEAEPFNLFKQAVALVEKYTDASSSYVALIEHTDDPPAELAEDEAESEDEEPPPVPFEEGEEGAEEPEPEPEPVEEQIDPNIVKFNYSECFLRYVASSEVDKPTIERLGVLTRPAPPPEDEEPPEGEEAPKVLPLPPTFSMLDEQVPTFYIPNVADDPSVRFFKRFPRMGAYFVSAVQSVEDEYKALLCADTVVPTGSGEKFSQEDRDFIWDISRSLTHAITQRDSQRIAKKDAEQAVEAFQDICKKVTEILYPPPPELEEGAEAPPPTEGDGAEGEGEVEEEPPAEEEDDIQRCQRELRNLEKHLQVEEKALEEAIKVVDVRKAVVALWTAQIEAVSGVAAAELQQMTHPPTSTYHVLKALGYILNEDMGTWSNWASARYQASVEFFSRVAAMDSSVERDMEAWTKARGELKACVDSKLPQECPDSNIGSLLRKFIRASRACANKAVIQREKEAVKAAREEEMKDKRDELEAEEKKKEAAEAAAAAEAEAAAKAEAEDGEEAAE
mmetsp:Transcript_22494/g.62390  ORF Transcript_22494/g.62390 Transcript_22494/m.62390 type:complete len:599 (-) Transcript_22494:214-2010(-)|eukprot:CAMPEP_0117663912 /NCGR_PEP_ID=MMETSP0804-20121206/8887_1 /TAXON_ID=1074897 /ORGANISM="Tetraselmis astigmatica, Strain CCMP880" /LENGTH=598 /DNA_ID=CAMNT_0005471005 /DNA_START=129 /DNA_END=1925 /DNA_ORIENTATION=+